jgi:hypothetical protein
VSTPFFVNATLAPAAGVVSVSVRSKSAGAQSNSVAGFRITNLPSSSAPPGAVTTQFLTDLQILLKNAAGSLSFIKTAGKGAINTGPLLAKTNTLQRQITSLLAMIAARPSSEKGVVIGLPFGPITINSLDSASLALSESMLRSARQARFSRRARFHRFVIAFQSCFKPKTKRPLLLSKRLWGPV